MGQPKEDIGTRKDLVFYRLQTAKADLKSARILLAAEEYKGANNRAYYAIFHAINAVHVLSGKVYKRHKDAIGNQREFQVLCKLKRLIKDMSLVTEDGSCFLQVLSLLVNGKIICTKIFITRWIEEQKPKA